MNMKDAFSILNIQSNTVTSEDIKIAYRKAAFKYHPDRNPAGLEMMKLVNAAYECLKDFEGTVEQATSSKDYGAFLNAALNAVIHLKLNIEICGAWIWVSGDTKPHCQTLKEAGYFWAPKKRSWYFRSEQNKSYNRSSWSMNKIRDHYGSQSVQNEQRQLLTH